MFLDWITARVDFTAWGDQEAEIVAALRSLGDRIFRVSPDGHVQWEVQAWDSVRSDTHGVVYRVGSDCLWIQGSPLRVIGDGGNVFSPLPSDFRLDVQINLQAQLDYLQSHIAEQVAGRLSQPFRLPPAARWHIVRVDITENFDLGTPAAVAQALAILRGVEGGRYRVSPSDRGGESVYWSKNSRHIRAKAYHKGPEMLHQNKRRERQHTPPCYTSQQIEAGMRLLRFEVSLMSNHTREHQREIWRPEYLAEIYTARLQKMVKNKQIVKTDDDVFPALLAAAPTEGRARAAMSLYTLIRAVGWHQARAMQPRSTFYRNLAMLRKIGLADADISHGRVVNLRLDSMDMRPVHSWDDLAA